MSDATYDISVVIPAYNQAGLMVRLLDSLAAQTLAHRMEIVVVNDCSPDDTGDVVQAWMANDSLPCATQYHCLEKNSGPGVARNAGLKMARGHLVCFTDTDCVADPQWVEFLIDKIDEERDIIGVGGSVEPLSINSIYALYYHYNHTLEPLKVERIPYLITCNCCYVRDCLLAVGGFDETIPFPGGEDIAASIHLYKKGYHFAYSSGALIYHDYRDNFNKFKRTWYCYGYGTSLVMHRLLSRSEVYPETKEAYTGVHYWVGGYMRPTVTGFRSFIRDCIIFNRNLKSRNAPWHARLRCLFVRPLDRWPYFRGWVDALADVAKERGVTPQEMGVPFRLLK